MNVVIEAGILTKRTLFHQILLIMLVIVMLLWAGSGVSEDISDNDTDAFETEAGTVDRNETDSDGDGYFDQTEIDSGSDPDDPAQSDPEIHRCL